ncbi:MAG: efflux RND transporter periplasmic adaptor subunit [Candidatus Krumholzibacteria bacterium]|nr:efflux RND transporter periplasmic adaptor subunit [Candidatus Krumholzibacteria bacterium]
MRYWKVVILAIFVILFVVVASMRSVPRAGDSQSPVGSGDHDHEHSTDEDHSGHDHEHSLKEDDADHGHEHTAGDLPVDHDHESIAEGLVHMTEEDMVRYGIAVAKTGRGMFDLRHRVRGELVLNADRTAQIVPRVAGIVRKVEVDLGDRVKAGEILAVIESRELADYKAAYLTSVEEWRLAGSIFEREDKLFKEGISSKSEFLSAKNGLVEAEIGRNSSERKLFALGFDRLMLDALDSSSIEHFALYEIRAPFDGTVIRKHLAEGESVADDDEIFLFSDLDSVWADLRLYQSDMGSLSVGQEVIISAKDGMLGTSGRISHIDPVMDRKTRTALARVVLGNRDGRLRPGTFISADIVIDNVAAELVAPGSAIQYVDDGSVVFVWDGDGFSLRTVTVGRMNDDKVEIVSGLSPGEVIAITNSFRIKAELEKSPDASCSGHGHAH